MKKIFYKVFATIVAAFLVGQVSAQTESNRLPIRTTDPVPLVQRTPAVLPIKSGGSGGSKIVSPALRSGGQSGTGSLAGSTTGAAANRPPIKSGGPGGSKIVSPALRSGGQPGTGSPAGSKTGAAALPPIKTAATGSGSIKQ